MTGIPKYQMKRNSQIEAKQKSLAFEIEFVSVKLSKFYLDSETIA